jgi:hypothetical protein
MQQTMQAAGGSIGIKPLVRRFAPVIRKSRTFIECCFVISHFSLRLHVEHRCSWVVPHAENARVRN